jgi:hypothetical protein
VETLLTSEFIVELSISFAGCLDGCRKPIFSKPADWQSFLNELTIEFELEELPFSESGPYLWATLFNTHLTTLRLLTSWSVIDALGQRLGNPSIMVTREGLGRLMEDLSFGGPPIHDVEAMRSDFPNQYTP